MILFVYGTRPESLKLAKIVALCRAKFPVTVWCTNQSPDLLDDRVLKPDNVGPVAAIPFELFDLVVVQGDTRSTFEAAVAAFNAGVPILHVEAGVRSGDLSSPFPEEGLRKCISALATYHACTTQHNRINLIRENVCEGGMVWTGPRSIGPDDKTVRVTGSPIVESVRERVGMFYKDFLGGFGKAGELFAVVTLHRRENRGHFADIFNGIDDALPRDLRVLWFSHPNGWAAAEFPNIARIANCGPLDAERFAVEVANARIVISDSGGVAEEATVLGAPSVQVRSVTDRPECLTRPTTDGKYIGGGSILGGVTRESVRKAIEVALTIPRERIDTSIYGDGTASQTIAEWIGEIVCK